MRNTFPLSLLAVMSLLFLASCTTAGTSAISPPSSSSGIVETSRGDYGRPSREGGRGHRPPVDTSDTVASTQSTPIDSIQKTETVQVSTPTPKIPTQDKVEAVTPTESTTITPLTSAPQASSSTPKTTSKSVTYSTDHGKERVTASFTVGTDSSGVITSLSASATSADRESQQYIRRFNSAAQSQIVGKKISSLSLSAVGGASDTTDAFMQVLNSL